MKEINNDEFDALLAKAFNEYAAKEFEALDSCENCIHMRSRRHKIRMNRFFREKVGSKKLPYPEVDNVFEKIRSKIVIFFKAKK